MTKELELNRDRAIVSIFTEIADGKCFVQILNESKQICLQYFPDAHNVLLNSFINFACDMQQTINFLKKINAQIESYKEKK